MNYLSSLAGTVPVAFRSFFEGARHFMRDDGLEATVHVCASEALWSAPDPINPIIPPTMLLKANHLIAFYNALPFDKPLILGNSPIERAVGIKAWMEGAGNAAILTCRELDLSGSSLAALPPEIGMFRNLVVLNLSGGELRALPPEIGQLRALTELSLSSNQLAALPPEIGQLRALTQLDLAGNQLAALPPQIGQLRALTELSLSYNLLAALPPELGQLQALTALDLSYNLLAALPPEIGQLLALTQLDLAGNQLAALLPEIGQLQALTKLDLKWNQLAALPPEIGQLRALTKLSLSLNQLAALPSEIGQLQALTQLSLSRNQLAALPPELGQLQALTQLRLSLNQLAALPDYIFSLSVNCTVEAENNPYNATALAQFQQRLLDHRFAHPGQGPNLRVSIRDDRHLGPEQTLTSLLQGWSQEFETSFPRNEASAELWENRTTDLTSLTSLSDAQATLLKTQLRRIREVADYRNGTPEMKNNVILRVERMVQLACTNPKFKGKLLNILETGGISCGDRVLILFNEIEIEWQFHHKELTDEEFIPLARRASLYDLLQKHAIEVTEKNGLPDEIETILDYHTRLRRTFNLPITTESMLYRGMSGVTNDMQQEAEAHMLSYMQPFEKLSEDQVLARSRHWQERQANRHKDAASDVDDKFENFVALAEAYYNLALDEREDWLKYCSPEFKDILSKTSNYVDAANDIMNIRERALAHLGGSDRKDPS